MARPPEPGGVVCLIGPRCSGKTSVGRELARRRAWEFTDLDEELLARARASGTCDSVGQALESLGLVAFRELEAECLRAALAGSRPRVIATGGGVVERADNRALLASVTCVWLATEPGILRARMRADSSLRPSLTGCDPLTEIEALLERREPLYRALATLTVDAGAGSPLVVCARVEAALQEAWGAEP